MRYIPGNAQNIGARQSQQDSFGFGEIEDEAFVAHAGFLAIVCDGMGGMQHGELASKTAVKAVLDVYRTKTPEESIPDALERSARAANDAVCDLSHSMGNSEGIGTTLVACVLHETNLYWISVGDSNAYLCRQGNMMLLTQAHVFSNLLDKAVARGTISREDADRHPERDSLTSFVGIEKLEEVDRNTQPFPLADGDTILIASDGLFKTLSDAEIVSMMQGPPPNWPELMVARTMAAQREHQDNVTVVTVTVTSSQDGFVPVAAPSGIQMPPPAPVGLTSAIGIPVPGGLPPVTMQAPVFTGHMPPATPMQMVPGEDLHPDSVTPVIPGAPAPFPPPPSVGASPAIPTSNPSAAPPPQSGMRWWPVLVLIGILLLAAAAFFVKKDPRSALPAAPKRQDSPAPTPLQTAPLPGVQAPALDPSRLIKQDPPGPDKAMPPKIEMDKPKPEAEKPKPKPEEKQ